MLSDQAVRRIARRLAQEAGYPKDTLPQQMSAEEYAAATQGQVDYSSLTADMQDLNAILYENGRRLDAYIQDVESLQQSGWAQEVLDAINAAKASWNETVNQLLNVESAVSQANYGG